jgi:ethanolamine ammonia-lyase small subunit
MARKTGPTRSPASKRSRAPASVGSAPPDIWDDLRTLTAARIGLKRSGASLATVPLLEFRLAHARARDAVRACLDHDKLIAELSDLGLPVLASASAATNHTEYLMRPDLGRRLAVDAIPALTSASHTPSDIVFVVTEGLSALAMTHVRPLLAETLPALLAENWRIAPLLVVTLGRVAIGDVVANAVNADIAVVLIGERPGLSSPDSMGAYITWRPSQATTDADRNCISNIRPDGITYADAAFKLLHLLRAVRSRRISGIALKDATDRLLMGQ